MHHMTEMVRSAEIDDLVDDYIELRLDPAVPVWFRRIGADVGWEQGEGYQVAHLIGMQGKRGYEAPDEFTAPDAWVYLPTPADWPAFADTAELRLWITLELWWADV